MSLFFLQRTEYNEVSKPRKLWRLFRGVVPMLLKLGYKFNDKIPAG